MSAIFNKLRSFKSSYDEIMLPEVSSFEGCQHHESTLITGKTNIIADQDSENVRRLEQRYSEFLVVESSLQKYWKTCTAFLEVSGLVQEGIDQLTADVLTFCSNVEEDRKVRQLEGQALWMRDAMPCEQVVNGGVRKHLLGPMGDRLRHFQDIKARHKSLKDLKEKYNQERRRVNKLRIDRSCDRYKLSAAEEALQVRKQKYEMTIATLESDLEEIHANRANILKDPFDAIRHCQVEFLQHLCGVLDGNQPVGNQEQESQDSPTELQYPEQRHVPQLEQLCQQEHDGNTQEHEQEHVQEHFHEHEHELECVQQEYKHGFEHEHQHDRGCESEQAGQEQYRETETIVSCSTLGIGQRHVVAKIVKDFHALKGHRIFERPAHFRNVNIDRGGQQHLHQQQQLQQLKQQQQQKQQQLSQAVQIAHHTQSSFVKPNEWSQESSTYKRVQLFARSITRMNKQQQEGENSHNNNIEKAVGVLQNFARVVHAQSLARGFSGQIVSVKNDPQSGCNYYLNAHSGNASWTRLLFYPK